MDINLGSISTNVSNISLNSFEINGEKETVQGDSYKTPKETFGTLSYTCPWVASPQSNGSQTMTMPSANPVCDQLSL